MKKLIFIFFLGFSLISCSSDDDTNDTNDEESIENPTLIGKWNWVITEGGISGYDQVTPEDSGKTFQLNFNEDSSYLVLENGIEKSNGEYTLTLSQSIYSLELENFISYSEYFVDDWIVVFEGVIRIPDLSSLTISDNNNDGFTSHFERIE